MNILYVDFFVADHRTRLHVHKFRAFYSLQCTQGFYSFRLRHGSKKIMSTRPESFHDCKGEFFYIKDAVIRTAMIVREAAEIPKEALKIPKGEIWYKKLRLLPWKVVIN
ncbi:hypothetical protein Hanom_Chr11g01024221 [Helianthus anomalus]